MYNATIRSRLSAMGQDNVRLLVDSWKKENTGDNFFYRLYAEGSEAKADITSTSVELDQNESDKETDESNDEIITKAVKQEGRLLFIHQTAWQSRLLMRYREDLTFLDATYKQPSILSHYFLLQ